MFSKNVLDLDLESEAKRICTFLQKTVSDLKKKGLVVGVSGGIDSSTCLGLAVRALGKERVLALRMPELDSRSDTQDLSTMLVDALGCPVVTEDLSPILAAAGCYQRRDEAIRTVFPEYNEKYKQKIVVPNLEGGDRITFFSVVIQSPSGETKKARLPLKAYLQIVAATNFKQRTRAMMEYYHGDRLNYAVIGTPQRLEYDQGFFVKGGDGLADIKPIAHLYKTQVYAMARHLGLPAPVCNSTPTTDTYSLEQGQDEFYFALPYDKMDLCLYAYNHKVPEAEVAKALGITADQVSWVYRDIQTKRRTTRYLHLPPILVDEVDDVGVHMKVE